MNTAARVVLVAIGAVVTASYLLVGGVRAAGRMIRGRS